MLLALKIWRKGSQAKECMWPLDAGKCKRVDSPLKPLKGMQPCYHLDFRLLTSAFVLF